VPVSISGNLCRCGLNLYARRWLWLNDSQTELNGSACSSTELPRLDSGLDPRDDDGVFRVLKEGLSKESDVDTEAETMRSQQLELRLRAADQLYWCRMNRWTFDRYAKSVGSIEAVISFHNQF
jgi:hypothetical protein